MKENILADSSKLICNIAVGKGNTSNIVHNKRFYYEKLKNWIISFESIKHPYCNTKIVKNQLVQLAPEEAIKYSKSLAKNTIPWFIAGHFEPQTRKTENLLFRSAIVLDVDNYIGTIGSLEQEVKESLNKYKYLAYSTSSHTPNTPKIRIIIFLDKELATTEYEQLARHFVEDLSFKNSVDIASFKPNQFMYISANIQITELPDGVVLEKYEPWSLENDGELLNPEQYKRQIIQLPIKQLLKKETLTQRQKIIGDDNNVEILFSHEKIEEYLKEYPATSLLYDEWLEVGFALHHNYTGSKQGYDIWQAWSLTDSRYDEEVNQQKWKSFSDKATPLTFLTIIKKITERRKGGWKQEILIKIRSLKEDFNEENELKPIIQSIATYCSLTEAEYYLREIKACANLNLSLLRSLLMKEKRNVAMQKAEEIKNKIYSTDETLPPAMFSGYVDDGNKLKTTIANLKVIIKAYGITVRRNITSREDEILIPNKKYTSETEAEAAFADLVSLCEMNNLSKSQHINSYCTAIGSENAYNPVLDFITSKEWDGKSRLQELYDTIVTEKGFSKELKELLVRKWLISGAAAVAEKDGLFSKGALVFQSKQSVGKTTWFKNIVPLDLREHFKEGCHLDPTNKDSVKTAISKWVVEFGELDSTLRKDIARFKAFISCDEDIFRVAYGKKDTKFARRTIFCGSVNERAFLVDQTGNVRFWAIPVVKLKYLNNIDMQQLWAEVYEVYKSGERWWLEQREEKILEESNQDHVQSCPYEEAFLDKFEIFTPNNDIGIDSYFKKGAKELLDELGWKPPRQNDMNQISAALHRLGAIREKRTKKFLVKYIPGKESGEPPS